MPLFRPKIFVNGLRLGVLLLMCAILAGSLSAGQDVSAATTSPKTGLVCTSGPSFSLAAKSGYISLPDGNSSFMWSYGLVTGAAPAGAFQFPGPFLCVNQGDVVSITLKNYLAEDVSMIFPGQTNVMANGVPTAPQFDVNGQLTSLTQVSAAKTTAGPGTITYTFVADHPGTFIYESGTDTEKQVNMGLFGGLVVRPAGHPDYAYGRSDSQFNPANEYAMIMSELDPALHQAVERNIKYDITQQHARYWMLNGRSFPDTIQDNSAPILPKQPYGSMVRLQPYSATANPNPALVRYLNVGALNHPFHPHGNHGRVIGRDGQAFAGPNGEDLSYEKFLVLVGAGQTYDVTYTWTDLDQWNPATNPIPVTLPQQQNLTYKDGVTWYSGSPYLGHQDDLPTGTTSYNQCGEYYQVWHSHALNEAANYDLGFGGMFTLERIDPPTATQTSTGHTCS